MNLSSWYQIKLVVEHASGISMDALHVLAGFLFFIVATAINRRSAASLVPWSALLVIELANEAYDLWVERWPDFASQLGEGLKDIILTMAVPTAILLIARWRPDWLLANERKEDSAND